MSELKKAGMYTNLDQLKDYTEQNPIGFDKPTTSSFNFQDQARKKWQGMEWQSKRAEKRKNTTAKNTDN